MNEKKNAILNVFLIGVFLVASIFMFFRVSKLIAEENYDEVVSCIGQNFEKGQLISQYTFENVCYEKGIGVLQVISMLEKDGIVVRLSQGRINNVKIIEGKDK